MNTQIAEAVETQTLEDAERQTVVHCRYDAHIAVRVWPSTFLVERESGRRAKLITAYNISFAPEWTYGNTEPVFTLIFEGLSQSCAVLDLVEDIPLPEPFVVKGILRNETDVYTISIT